MRLFFLCVIISFTTIQLNAQEFYTLSKTSVGPYFEIQRLNSDNSFSLIQSFIPPGGCYDIALSPSGIFYGINSNGLIYRINNTGDVSNIIQLPIGEYNSLVCSNNNELYSIGVNGNLYKYNLTTNITTIIFDTNDYPTGDLTFYKGNLIFQSATDFNFKAINLSNFSITTILCGPPESIDDPLSNQLYGISTLFEDCDNQSIVAVNYNGGLFALNFENHTIDDLNISLDSLDYTGFYGSTSNNEHLASECSFFQFENVDCNLNLNESNLSSKNVFYPNPTKGEIQLNNSEHINQLEIFDLSGKILLKELSPKANIDLSNFDKGIYILVIKYNSHTKVEKIVKN